MENTVNVAVYATPFLAPIFWLLIAIALTVVEALTVQLVAIWFALGSLAAIVPAMLRMPMWVQLLVFALIAGLSMACTRPFVKRFLNTRKERTNADRVVGETGIVLEEINNLASTGRATVMGLDWTARSADGSTIPAGAYVVAQAIDGVKLVVLQAPAAGNPK